MEGKEFKIISAKTLSLCILSGIAVAQLISCLDLFQSNSQLAKTIHALNQAGYRVVPAGEALTSLGEKMAAFAGALFLSLTAGTAIATAATTLLIILSCSLWRQNRLTPKKSIAMRSALISISIWSSISILTIVAGESSFTAAYTFFIPLVIAALFFLLSSSITEKKRAEQNKNLELTQSEIGIQSEIGVQIKLKISLIFIICLSIAASFYFSRCDRSLFLRARDYILLSSRPGELLNEFYYRYTLYAAEAIKPHAQKEINFSSASHKINPYSEEDKHRIMRLLCLAGLTAVLPILSYLYSFLSIFYIIRLCTILLIRLCTIRICSISLFSLNSKMVQNGVVLISGIISGIIITGLSVAFLYHLYPLYLYDDKAMHNIYRGSDMRIKELLCHSDYRIRVEGLREISVESSTAGEQLKSYGESRKIHGEGGRMVQIEKETIWNYPEVITRTMRYGEIAERYWLANAFAAAKEHSALPYLEKLIDDPSINVQCAAIAAVATIGMELQPDMVRSDSERDSLQSDLNSVLNMPHILRREIIELLERKIVKSSEWYVQKSAYDGLEKIRKI